MRDEAYEFHEKHEQWDLYSDEFPDGRRMSVELNGSYLSKRLRRQRDKSRST